LQTADQLSIELFLTRLNGAEEDLHLNPDEAVRILKPLYGLCTEIDLWHAEFAKHHKAELDMSFLDTEHVIFARFHDNMLEGITGLYVDDTLSMGSSAYDFDSENRNIYENRTIYDTSGRRYESGTILGCTFKQREDGSIGINQAPFLQQLRPFPSNATFYMFRSQRLRLQ
jgi:hypothetical protein